MTTLVLIWGIRRSGNHVVRNWIASQFKSGLCATNVITSNLMNVDKVIGADRTKELSKVLGIDWTKKVSEQWGSLNKIVSFEEHPLSTIGQDYEQVLGKHDSVKKVVILRDPYNLFASRIKHYNRMLDSGVLFDKEGVTLLWREYAEFFVGKPSGVILVSYNRFVSDKGYRQELSEKLGGSFNDSTIDRIDENARGSSFDGMSFDGKASEMRVFDRWKVYKDNKDFRALFTKEIRDLAKKIFNFTQPW